MDCPSESFNIYKDDQSILPETLKPSENLILKYNFEKKQINTSNPKISNVNIIFLYEKNEKS